MAKKHYAELSSSKTALITQQRAEYEASIDRAGYNNNSSSNGDTDQMGYNNNNNNMNYEGNSQQQQQYQNQNQQQSGQGGGGMYMANIGPMLDDDARSLDSSSRCVCMNV